MWNGNGDIYYWNKSQTSPLSYQEQYCSMRCRGEDLVAAREENSCWSLECIRCFCKRPACEIYDNCCPDMFVPFGRKVENLTLEIDSKYENKVNEFQRTTRPNFGCDNKADKNIFHYAYVRSCFPEYLENKTVVELCERGFDLQRETIETFIRVVDMTTKVIYKNMFCALCSNVKEFVPLQSQLTSETFKGYYQSKTRNEMLQQLLMTKRQVFTVIPENVTTYDCPYPKPKIVDQCNTSEIFLLPESSPPIDEDVVRACHSLQGNGLQVYDRETQVVYANIFCAICNMQTYPHTFEKCECRTSDFSFKPLPFSILLDLRSRSEPTMSSVAKKVMKNSHCSVNEWTSPDGQCLPLKCAPGKYYQINECTEIFADVTGLGYILRLWLIPMPTEDPTSRYIKPSKDVVKLLVKKMQGMFKGSSTDYNCLLNVFQIENPNTVTWETTTFSLECDILASINLTRKHFEMDLQKIFINTMIDVQINKNIILIFKTYCSLQGYRMKSDKTLNYRLTVFFNDQIVGGDMDILPRDNKEDFLNLTEILLCPYVRFDQRLFQVTIDNSVLPPNIRITLDLNITKLNITDLNDFSMVEIDENGGLNVCQDLLDSKLKEVDKDNIQQDLLNRKLKGTSLAEYIVSITCCVASIVCLLMTLLTYFMFPVLRTEAGINNMFLSSSLLLSQLSLLATAHIFRSSVMCTIIGLTTHFLWLMMFSWSFICSFHMFKVFTSSTRRTTTRQSETADLWKKIVLSLVCPALVVMTTVMCSYFISGGEEIGYGLSSCYLNSTLLVGVTMVGPLSCITIANLLFFLVAVYKIYKVRSLQSTLRTDDQQNHWYVYARLSSVTGAFWTVAIVASASDSDILKIVSVILNGLQGLTIFVSFICNKRVVSLYRKIIVRRPQGEHRIQTGTELCHQ